MSAGKGVMHSEFNHRADGKTHLLQIWIEPDVRGVSPSYEQTYFAPEEKRGVLRQIASPDGQDGSVTIHANTRLYAGLFHENESATHLLAKGRMAYVHVARGSLEINGHPLGAGDALKVRDAQCLDISQGRDSEILLFDLPSEVI